VTNSTPSGVESNWKRVARPDHGAGRRDGVIAAVSYTHADQSAQVTIDNSRDNLEALLHRLGALGG
jgi:hypothetical protein